MWVEAELGEVGGKDGVHAPGARTKPDEAAAYVARTGVDALAVAVGTSHAMTTKDAALDLALIAELRAAVPVPLVLHGSSGVPDDDLAGRHGRHDEDQHRHAPEQGVHRRVLRDYLPGDDEGGRPSQVTPRGPGRGDPRGDHLLGVLTGCVRGDPAR